MSFCIGVLVCLLQTLLLLLRKKTSDCHECAEREMEGRYELINLMNITSVSFHLKVATMRPVFSVTKRLIIFIFIVILIVVTTITENPHNLVIDAGLNPLSGAERSC